jgi:hypothetical protein
VLRHFPGIIGLKLLAKDGAHIAPQARIGPLGHPEFRWLLLRHAAEKLHDENQLE